MYQYKGYSTRNHNTIVYQYRACATLHLIVHRRTICTFSYIYIHSVIYIYIFSVDQSQQRAGCRGGAYLPVGVPAGKWYVKANFPYGMVSTTVRVAGVTNHPRVIWFKRPYSHHSGMSTRSRWNTTHDVCEMLHRDAQAALIGRQGLTTTP